MRSWTLLNSFAQYLILVLRRCLIKGLRLRNSLLKLGGENGAHTVPVYDIVNAGPNHRFLTIGCLCSNCTLGLGYSMGAAKFVDTCKSQGLELDPVPVEQWPELDRRIQFILRNVVQLEGDPYSEENRETVGRLIKSLQIVDDWRKSNTKIVNKWHEYADSFKMAITAGWDVISFRLASGRIKRYYNPCLFKEPTVEIGEDGKKHPGFRLAMRAETVRGNPATFFTGGNIMENIVQATCRDIMAYSAVEIERKHPQWKYVFSVYDEIVFEIPEGDAEEASVEIPRIMCHGDLIAEWTEGLPLEVEGDIADRYHK